MPIQPQAVASSQSGLSGLQRGQVWQLPQEDLCQDGLITTSHSGNNTFLAKSTSQDLFPWGFCFFFFFFYGFP